MNNDQQLKGLELLANHEEVLGQLYSVYGMQQPDHREFWRRFHDEEEIHAKWIRDFMDDPESSKINVDPDRFPFEMINGSINQLISLKNEAIQGGMSFADQLQVALRIERELLEDRFFETNESDDMHLKMVLDKLRIGTDVHRERLAEELEKQNF
jgi:hypothetical protein